MRIAICDDEDLFRFQIRDAIDKIYGSMDVIIDMFSDGRRLLERFDTNPYDVLFLDIEMPAMDGITIAKRLRDRSEDVFIVFLTSHMHIPDAQGLQGGTDTTCGNVRIHHCYVN